MKVFGQRDDYDFCCYEEICNFVYCLMLKTRSTDGLPGIHEWESYMSMEKIASFLAISADVFLVNFELGQELLSGKTSEVQKFSINCRKFVVELIQEIVCHRSVSSVVSRGLYCFGPEILLDGDSDSIFGLFAGLCKLLVYCGVLPLGSSSAAVDEFYSYVVEKRRQYAGSDRSGSAVFDVMTFLLGDYSFQSRHNVLRIFKLCCLIVSSGRSRYTSVLLELPGSALDQKIVDDCVRMVQSYVLSPGYAPKLFFTDLTLDSVRDAVEDASVFYVTDDFDVWKSVSSSEVAAFVSGVRASFLKLLSQRREATEKDYTECNRANRQNQIERRAGSSRSESVVSVAAKPKKTMVSGSKRGEGSSSKSGSSKTGSKRKSSKNVVDRGVYHNLKRSSGN